VYYSRNPIGIVCALTQEIEAFLKSLASEDYQSYTIRRRRFYCGLGGDREVVIVESGWGKVRAASATQLLIDIFTPAAIINLGTAGAINPERNIGDIILSESALEYDFHGIEGEAQRPKKADEDLLRRAWEAAQSTPYGRRTYRGLIISGDQDINSREKKEYLWRRYQAQCGEWEGAAIATVARLNNIPWLLIKAISDLAEEDFASQFRDNSPLVARSSAEVALRLIEQL